MPNAEQDRIVFLVEDCSLEDGRCRQLECSCIVRAAEDGRRLVIDAVRNAVTHELISDVNDCPHPSIVRAAAELYEWHWNHQQVFSEGRVMRPQPQ